MRLEQKVLKALEDGGADVYEIAEMIWVSPYTVLKTLEYLDDVGVLSTTENIKRQRTRVGNNPWDFVRLRQR